MVKTSRCPLSRRIHRTTIPKDMAERLHIVPGDRLFAIETENGILLTRFDPVAQKR